MAELPFDLATANRWLAVELNNTSWDWLEAGEYDGPAAERVVHSAHAACHHWLQVGNVANHQRGECLVANVHAAAGNGEAAIRHARRAVELLNEHADEMADWDYAFVYDALARGFAAAADMDHASEARQQARDYAAKIAEADERDFFDKWHSAGNWHGLK
jgi:hypothetical protein